MPLKTIVKVGNISNLSDARYCSGMGVDMLGFRVIEGQSNYIAPKAFQEIRGWISGPKVVAEVYGIGSLDKIPAIIENYAPDYFEMSLSEFQRFGKDLPRPVIIKVNKASDITVATDRVSYVIVDQKSDGIPSTFPILIKPQSKEQLQQDLDRGSIQGVALDGSAEERPGFKDYTDLADILEFLDEY
jgi:phosphoribosylanthranilate isomerase